MEYTAVASSNILAIGFEDATLTLGVQFKNGTEYHYFGVSRDVFEGFLGASSKGTYLDQFIKKAGYPCSRVR